MNTSLRDHIRAALPEKRLIDVCGRLASDFDGERAAAASIATRMLHEAGMSWAELVALAFADSPAAEPEQRHQFRSDSWQAAAHWLIDEHCARLNDWEFQFLQSILDRDELSEKQTGALARIFRKFRRPQQ